MNSITYPYLSDLRFLKELDELNIKEQFVKIIVLDWLENPIANIEGRVSGGSMNLDGSSAVRRSGSITFICDDEYYNVLDVNNLISINKKIKIEIGYANTTDKYTGYDKIWFPQGVFVIINPSITHNNQGLSIAISFKDKMCLLNGECGGVLPASVTFHEREEEDGTITRVTYYQIIQELVSEFGGEQLGKIIINDVDTRIKKVMKWVGDEPITLKGTFSPMSRPFALDRRGQSDDFDGEPLCAPLKISLPPSSEDKPNELTVNIVCTTESQDYKLKIELQGQNGLTLNYNKTFSDLSGSQAMTYTQKIVNIQQTEVQVKVNLYGKPVYYGGRVTASNFIVNNCQPQDDIGYIYTDFCPTSDLVGNAGQNVVTILDNIKKQLGNYEYFYDIDGNFIFQEIRNYLNTSQSTNEYETLISQGYLTPALAKSVYQFTDSRLITAYQNTPQYANIKNDFIVWGIRESAAGAKMPIRYHVAFDTKPYVGNTYYCFTQTDDYGQEYISRVFSPKPGVNKTITTDALPTVGGRGDAWYVIQSETEVTAEGDTDDENTKNEKTAIPTSDFYLFNCTLIAQSQAVQMNGDLYEFNFDHDITLQKGQKYIIELSMLNRDRFKNSLVLPDSEDSDEQYHISGRFNDKIPFGDEFYLNTEAYTWYFIYSPDEQGEKTFRMFSFDKRPKDTNYEPHQSRDYDLALTAEDFVSIYSYIDNEAEPDRWQLFEQNVSDKDTQPKTVITQNYQTELYIQGVAMPGSNRYYSELATEWPKMFQLKKHTGANSTVTWRDEIAYSTIDLEKQIPANPDYYLDIIEPTSKVGEFSIPSIGVRSKVWNDNAVNCIFETDPPDIILIETGTPHTEADRNEAMSNSDSYYQVPSSIYNALAGGGYQNSAFNAIRDVLYQYTNYNESITLTALPIYYLEPNTRITVEDEKSSIHGDYMIKSISRPFDCNGTMQITATKALERF